MGYHFMKEVTAKQNRRKTWLSIINIATVIFVLLLIFGSSWMAKNWFAYEKTTQRNVKEPYTHVINLETYVCYITRTGECYHEDGCSYLKSKIETTVYRAKMRGYRACSRCDPPDAGERTAKYAYETRYREVTKTEVEIVEPEAAVFYGGCGILLALYLAITIPLKNSIKKERC